MFSFNSINHSKPDMSDQSRDKIIRLSSNLLKFIGETSPYTSVKLRAFRAFNLLTVAFTVYFALLNFFHVSGEGYITAVGSFMSVSHLFLKYLLLLYYKNDTNVLLINMKNRAWNYHDFSEKVRNTSRRIYRIVDNAQTVVFIVSCIIMGLYILKPLYNTEYVLLLEAYISDVIAVDAALLLSQFYLFYLATPVILSYDLTYLFLCVEIVLQLKLLTQKIQNAVRNNNSSTTNEIRNYINYHQFLLVVFRKMKSIYSIMLLFHYFVTLITTCTDIFVLVRYVGVGNIAIKITTLAFLFGQFAYYTFPADEVACQFSNTARSIYMSEWYSSNVQIKKSLLFMMVKCQRIQYFSGAGLLDINADAFGSVVRKSFSFYAIMKNVLTK